MTFEQVPEHAGGMGNTHLSQSDAVSFDMLWRRALEDIENKKYRGAIRTLEEILQKFPQLEKTSHSNVLALGGKLYFWLGETANAKQLLNHALQLNAHNAGAHIILGKIAMSEYFFVKARGHLASVDRPNAEADLALCRLCIKLRDIKQANAALRQASHSIPSTNPEYRLLHAFLGLLAGDHKNAVTVASALMKEQVFAKDPDALLLVAELFITAGSYPHAVEILNDLMGLCADNDQMWGLLAQCSYADQKYDEAGSRADHALNLNPFNAFAMTVLLKLATHRGDYQMAVTIGRKILSNSPEYPLAHANLGDAYFLMGEYECAKQEYLSADEYVHTETKGSQLRKARMMIIERKYEEAGAMLEALLQYHGLLYDDALCDLLLVYDLLHQSEKKQELIQRMQVRRTLSHRVDDMLTMVTLGKPLAPKPL